ncbi:hypothetical protein J2741_000344 [Methanolinea mesophila]|uniref:DUF3795 domain-containing protein n=1 Tax=Methanolinea mesophila TaxID=547055 RepID=UPI001AE9FD0D|nr:DUF3795 domain-containing protein [Methanolinea mesophila]MBP1927797.1 hypothetical protein [Methanolinea mesophila]
MSLREIGCCGAYCGTCKVFAGHTCKGCKIGYADGERDLSKAKCRIKVCCMGRGYKSCADCPDFADCTTLNEFFGKKGYKYRRYREALEFIRRHGYAKFVKIADTWKNAYGIYPKE